MKTIIQTKDHLAYTEMDKSVIAWNRFCPSIIRFNKKDFSNILELNRNKDVWSEYEPDFIDQMKEQNILDDFEPGFRKRYEQEIDQYVKGCTEKLLSSTESDQPFQNIGIFTEKCNLKCGYCVMKHTWEKNGARKNHPFHPREAWRRIKRILDTNFAAMKAHHSKELTISFNGGEFLIHFDLMKEIISYVRAHENGGDTTIEMNTNGTLLSREKLDFFHKNRVGVFISIDGNKAHHDQTRVYADGRGSFDDVIQAVKRLQSYTWHDENIGTSFQGSLDFFDSINIEDIFKLNDLGLKQGRLSPNLMGVGVQEAVKKTRHFYDLVKQSQDSRVQIGDGVFAHFKNAIDNGFRYQFAPHCNGLSGSSGRALDYNVSRDTGSYLCQFVVGTAVPVTGTHFFRDSELAFQAAEFQKKRARALLDHCMECPVIGICRGGCIMSGITADNEINPAACAYKKELWYLNLRDMHKNRFKFHESMETCQK